MERCLLLVFEFDGSYDQPVEKFFTLFKFLIRAQIFHLVSAPCDLELMKSRTFADLTVNKAKREISQLSWRSLTFACRALNFNLKFEGGLL